MSEDGVNVSEGSSAVIDFGGVEDVKREILPPGKYPAMITQVNPQYSKAGHPMWQVMMSVIGGDYDDRKLFTYISFSPNALPYTKQTLANIWPEILEQAFEFDDPEVYGQMENVEVVARVAVEKYEGEDRNQVKGLTAAK